MLDTLLGCNRTPGLLRAVQRPCSQKSGALQFSSIIKGLVKRGWPDKATDYMGKMKERGVDPDVVTSGTLIDGFFKCQGQEAALDMYHETLCEDLEVNKFVVDSLVSGLRKNGKIEEAEALFKDMDEHVLLLDHGFLKQATCQSPLRLDSAEVVISSLVTDVVKDGTSGGCKVSSNSTAHARIMVVKA